MMNEKNICQQAIFPFLLGVAAARALSGSNLLYISKTQLVLEKMLAGFNKDKILRRIGRTSSFIINSLVDKQTDEVNGHKFILVIYFIAQKALDSGIVFDQELLDLFDVFFEIEAEMSKNHEGKVITEQDYSKLKESAERTSTKIFQIIRNV